MAGRVHNHFYRPWTFLDSVVPVEARSNDPSLAEFSGRAQHETPFRIISFNCLAESLVDEKYKFHDHHIMRWENRKLAVVSEIIFHNPDVFALQEIDESSWGFLRREFGRMGYDGYYKKKTGEKFDGVATFWRQCRFMLLDQIDVNFKGTGVMYGDQVGLIVLLWDRLAAHSDPEKGPGTPPDGRSCIIVVNTHILFNKKRGDTKLAQLCNLLAAGWNMYVKYSSVSWKSDDTVVKDEMMDARHTSDANKIEGAGTESPESESVRQRDKPEDAEMENKDKPPEERQPCAHGRRGASTLKGVEEPRVRILQRTPCFVVCGDFNLVPQSALYHWLSSGELDFNGLDLAEITEQRLMFEGYYGTDQHGHGGHGSTHGSFVHPMDRNWTSSQSPSNNSASLVSLIRYCERSPKRHKVRSLSRTKGWIKGVTDAVDPFPCRHVRTARVHPSITSSPSAVESYIKNQKSLLFRRRPECYQPRRGRRLSQNNCESDMELSDGGETRQRTEPSLDTGNERRSSTQQPEPEDHTVFRIPFKLQSAYSTPHPTTNKKCEPAFTAFKGGQRGTVDYIWLAENETKVVGICELPHWRDALYCGCIPNKEWSVSDHFSLVADLVRKPESDIHDILVWNTFGLK